MTKNRIITFTPSTSATPIYLKCDTAWSRKVGLAPGVNHGVCSYVEFGKLGGNPLAIPSAITGTISFWYNGEPGNGRADVSLVNETLIAIEPLEMADTPADGVRTVEYRLYFSDFRCNYVDPRGGRLQCGILNPANPQQASGYVLGQVPTPAPPQAPSYTMSQLIKLALKAMGLGGVAVPKEADNVAPPTDLKWLGNHAPTELKKLLDLCHCAFIPNYDGSVTIAAVTNKGEPKIPAADALPVQQTPAIDRRGKSVVITSYPRAVIHTQTDTGSDPSTWQFVCQDSKSNWVPIWQCDLLTNRPPQAGPAAALLLPMTIDPIAAIKADFANAPPEFRQQLRSQVFSCIQASQSPPADLQPVLRTRIEKDWSERDIQVLAQIAEQSHSGSGMWQNSATPVTVAVLARKDRDVLLLDRPLLTVAQATATPNLDVAGPAGFQVRYSYEGGDVDDKGNFTPSYFRAGFTSNGAGGAITQLSDGDCENAINGKGQETIILARPNYRLLVVDDQQVNYGTLLAQAKSEATQWLADASQPARIYAARGFANIPLSGLVTEVQWSQEAVKTTVHTADWFAAVGALGDNSQITTAGGTVGGTGSGRMGQSAGDAYPAQVATDVTRLAAGESGAAQPCVPIAAPTRDYIPPGMVELQIVATSVGQAGSMGTGTYWVAIVSGRAKDVDATKDFMMPEPPMTVANSDNWVIAQNLSELPLNVASHTQMIPTTGKWYVYGMIQGGTKTGKPLYHFHSEFPLCVTLTHNGGVNGTVDTSDGAITNATYTYDVVNQNGQTIATAQSPLWARPPGVLVGPATNGLIDSFGRLLSTDEQGALYVCTTGGG